MHQILIGDCRQTLLGLPASSVHMIVTSPPYFGLRNYGSDGQIGLERTPEEYIAALVDTFRSIRRVLRGDGIVWLNIGDSYVSSPAGNKTPSGLSQRNPKRAAGNLAEFNTSKKETGLNPGNLMGIPWRLALALQADGWWLRADVIWAKGSPMPESVAGWRWERCRTKNAEESLACPGCEKCTPNDGYVLRVGSWRPTRAHEFVFLLAKSDRYFSDGESAKEQTTDQPGSKRNPRDVWAINSVPSQLGHFAMMPPAMVEKCLRTGPKEVCASCGAPWAPIVEHPGVNHPTCLCKAASGPPTVLDPFLGAGTVAGVAEVLGWHWVGCELSADYVTLVPARIEEVKSWANRHGITKVG